MPFKTVSSYGAMLNKLAVANFCLLVFLWILALDTQSEFLSFFDSKVGEVEIFGLKLKFGVLVPPLLVALIFRGIKLHDTISDLLKIREKYDVDNILSKFRERTGVNVSITKIKENRKKLMGRTFYKYASSTASETVIDKHLIEMVLDQLSWYWMCVESIFTISCFLLFFLFSAEWQVLMWLLIADVVLVVMAKVFKNKAKSYTAREVDIILEKESRVRAIREVFDDISNR